MLSFLQLVDHHFYLSGRLQLTKSKVHCAFTIHAMSLCLVTALFDLDHHIRLRTGSTPTVGRRRAPEQYLSLFRWIVRMGLPTIVFVDPHLQKRIEAIIEDMKVKTNQVTVLPLSIRQLPAWQRL